jgi:hypothetical protein
MFGQRKDIVDRCATCLRILRGVVVAAQPQRVGPPWVLDESRVHTRTALVLQGVDGDVGQRVRVVGIGHDQVPLGGDVRSRQPAHPLAESRSQPILRDPVVPRGGDFAEERNRVPTSSTAAMDAAYPELVYTNR